MLRSYDQKWRSAYEGYAGIAWMAAIPIYLFVAPDATGIPIKIFVCMFALAAGLFRLSQTWEIWRFRVGLLSRAPWFLSATRLRNLIKKNKSLVWLGIGYEWEPEHTQRMYDLRRVNLSKFKPPLWLAKLVRKIDNRQTPAEAAWIKKYVGDISSVVSEDEAMGSAFIHGLENENSKKEIKSTIEIFEGHTAILGAPGAGKTRCLEVIATQSIARGSVTVCIDPKGDVALAETLEREAKANGVPFVYFHLAFPDKSVRFDAFKNVNRTTEFASRISAIVGSETNDSFSAYSWLIPDAICSGMVMVKEKPSLKKVLRHINLGVGDLLIKVLEVFFEKQDSSWQGVAKSYVQKKQKNPTAKITDDEKLAGYTEYYKNEFVRNGIDEPDVSNLIEIAQNDKQWVGKMLAGLIPVLRMLSAGETGDLLSPDYEDTQDERPIWDFEKVIASNAVMYIGLDALSDETVCNAVGSLLLTDLASTAGARYNFGTDMDKRVEIVVDESSNVVNGSFIQVLNKGRGAKYVIWMFAQTIQDFTVKLGSAAAARKLLGNCNNLIAFRSKDAETQKYIVEEFGESLVESISSNIAVGDSDDLTSFGDGRLGKSMSESMQSKVPQDLVGQLPNFNYIANIGGGKIIQGKLPIIIGDKENNKP